MQALLLLYEKGMMDLTYAMISALSGRCAQVDTFIARRSVSLCARVGPGKTNYRGVLESPTVQRTFEPLHHPLADAHGKNHIHPSCVCTCLDFPYVLVVLYGKGNGISQ